MKKMIRVWIALAFVLVLVGRFEDFAYGDDSEFDYEVDKEAREVTIYGYYGTEENLVIPEEIEGYKVTGVYFAGYYEDESGYVSGELNTTIKTIYLPSGVNDFNIRDLRELTDIYVSEDNEIYESYNGIVYWKRQREEDEGYEWYLSTVPPGKAGEIDIREGTTGIGYSAFRECSKITAVNIPASLEYDEEMMYTGNICGESLVMINVAEGSPVYSSVDGVLYDKERKKLIRYPNGRSEVEFLDTINEIGQYAFHMCDKITEVKFNKGLEYIGGGAFGSCTALRKVSFQDSATWLGGYVFSDCTSLSDVDLSNSVKNIASCMFDGCTALETLRIPASVESIDFDAFGNSGIKELVVDEGNAMFSSKDGMICDKAGSKLITYFAADKDTVIVPDYITSIGKSAFGQLGSVKKIVLPQSVNTIEDSAFGWCVSLEEVELPEGIESIPSNAFEFCFSLKSISIPSTVKSIGDQAFYACFSLESLTIPKNVTNLGKYLISNTNIHDLYLESSGLVSIGEWAFENWDSPLNIYVSEKSVYDKINGKTEYGKFNAILLKTPEPLELNTYSVTLYTGNVKKSVSVKPTLTGISGTVKWKTSNKSVATVKNGKITAVSKGNAVVTVSVGKYSKKVKVAVKNPEIIIADGSESISSIKVKKGKTIYYRVNTNPSKSGVKLKVDKNTKKYAKITYKNNTLSVKGIKKGTVKFKLQSGKGTKAVKVRIS